MCLLLRMVALPTALLKALYVGQQPQKPCRPCLPSEQAQRGEEGLPEDARAKLDATIEALDK